MKTELLSPAGDLEAAYSALYFGADAVYLGLRQFSARAEATNFSPEELDEITAYAHHLGKKIYVTMNTVIQEDEIGLLFELLAVCDRCHVDALIVQDLGVARLIRTTFPNLALHASTQMAVHNAAGASALKKLGFSRVVLARELTLNEIQKIQKEVDIELEVFVHGALCYSYSGLCLFSSLTTGRSANRGRCVYSCRNEFKMNGRQYHPFSMKDLALEQEVLKLKGLSLKIEGRKKTALYVGAVTDYYRRILDTGKTDGTLADNLKQIFARPWTKLHFNGRRKDVIDPDFVGHRGLKIGTVDKIFNHTITFKPQMPVARYDGIQIDIPGTPKPFGFSAENLTVNGKKVYEVPAGQIVTVALPPHHPFIQKGWTVYLASSTRVKGAYSYQKPKAGIYKNRQEIAVDVFVEPDRIMACTDTVSVDEAGRFNPAQNPDKTEAAVRSAFAKTGDTVFELKELRVHNPRALFVPVSVLNNLRRRLYEAVPVLETDYDMPATPLLHRGNNKPRWIIKTDDLSLARQLDGYDELILVTTPQTMPSEIALLPKDKLRLALPAVLRPEGPWQRMVDRLYQAGYKHWEIGNLAGWAMLPKEAEITLDNTITMMNTQAIEQALETGATRVAFSVEDTGDNIRTLAQKTTQTVLVVYQDIPLFLSDNCVRENDCRVCPKGRLEAELSSDKAQYLLISENCQTAVIAKRAFAVPPEGLTIPAWGYRVDFCRRHYTFKQAADILSRLKAGQKIPQTSSGNFEKQFAK